MSDTLRARLAALIATWRVYAQSDVQSLPVRGALADCANEVEALLREPPQEDWQALMRMHLRALAVELDRIARINSDADRPRTVPELTVYMWLKAAQAICDPDTARATAPEAHDAD